MAEFLAFCLVAGGLLSVFGLVYFGARVLQSLADDGDELRN